MYTFCVQCDDLSTTWQEKKNSFFFDENKLIFFFFSCVCLFIFGNKCYILFALRFSTIFKAFFWKVLEGLSLFHPSKLTTRFCSLREKLRFIVSINESLSGMNNRYGFLRTLSCFVFSVYL